MSTNKIDFLNKKRYNIDLNLYTCGHEKCPPSMRIGPIPRYHYIIHYVVSGKGTFEINNQIYCVGPGQGFLIEPDILTTYESDSEEPWEYMWIGFVGSKAKEYLDRANLSSHSPIFTYHKGDALERCLSQTVKNLTLGRNNDILLNSNLYEFMYLLVDNNDTTPPIPILGKAQQAYIEQAMLFCENNFHTAITVQDVADHIKINRTYLNKLFHEYIGKSPKQFLMELRMNKACKLLLETGLDVYTIATEVGYHNQFQFSKIFKKYKSVSPSEYRRQVPTEWFLIDPSER